MNSQTRDRRRFLPTYSRLEAAWSRLPEDLRAQENDAACAMRSNVWQQRLLEPPLRPADDRPLFTTLWANRNAAVTIRLPKGGFSLPVFSTRVRAADYADVRLGDAGPLGFGSSTPIELARLLGGLPKSSVSTVAFDVCPRCAVAGVIETPSLKRPADLITLWAIHTSTHLTRLELYLDYAIRSVNAGKLAIARDICLEIVAHVAPDDIRAHVLLGQLAVKLNDQEMLRESGAFLRETMVRARLLSNGDFKDEDAVETVAGRRWAQDPYDDTTDAADPEALRCISDDEVYDTEFPDHPLSQIRALLRTLAADLAGVLEAASYRASALVDRDASNVDVSTDPVRVHIHRFLRTRGMTNIFVGVGIAAYLLFNRPTGWNREISSVWTLSLLAIGALDLANRTRTMLIVDAVILGVLAIATAGYGFFGGIVGWAVFGIFQFSLASEAFRNIV